MSNRSQSSEFRRGIKPASLIGLALSMLTLAQPAHAIFDVEALVGKRWYQLNTAPNQTNAAQEVAIAAHIDPIPLVPVAFGARVGVGTLNTGDITTATADSGATFTGAVDITAWIPLIPFFTPYGRVSVPVLGTYVVKGKTLGTGVNAVDYASTAKISGLEVGIGARMSLLPLTELLFEVNRGMETYKEDQVKVAGIAATADSKSYSLSSNAFLVGLRVGL